MSTQRPASSNIRYWLALKFVPRLKTANKLKLVDTYGIEPLFQLSKETLAAHGLTAPQINAICAPNWQKIDNVMTQSAVCNSQLISYACAQYPLLLKEISSPPLILFVKGNVALLQHPQVAIVGSRSTTLYGKENATNLASDLVNYELVITSGLALGVDGFAHRGALNNHGKTIAVLATGLDKIYPARHLALAKDILANEGLLVSESIPGTPVTPGLFPKRNRLISGLSLGVVVVEAALKSGSLVTAKYALEQNREVFAVPGSIINPLARGCHQIIKQGAKLVEETADIIIELDLPHFSGQLEESQEKGKKITAQVLCNDQLLDSVGYETTPVDLVVSRSKLPIDVVLTRLTILELRGLVSAVPGGYLKLNRG